MFLVNGERVTVTNIWCEGVPEMCFLTVVIVLLGLYTLSDPHHPSSQELRWRLRTELRHSPLFRVKHLPSHCLSACLALQALLLLAPRKEHSDGLWPMDRQPRHTWGVPQNDSALSVRKHTESEIKY